MTGGQADPLPKASKSKRLRAIIGFIVGLALFGGAIWSIAAGDHDFKGSLEAARNAPWWVVALVVVLPIANWLIVSESFRALNGRYAKVGHAEMAGLIGSAWLLNYLPMKPGLLGRLAYHKQINKIRYQDSARVLGFSVSMTGVAIGLLIAVAALMRIGGPGWVWCALPVVGLGAGAFITRNRGPWTGRVVYTALLRYIDSMIWIGRYAASFALVGSPLSFENAVAVTAVSQITLLIPISGNGLGVREWGVRLATSPAGLLADVVNRAAEMAVALPIGIIGTLWSVRRLRAHNAGNSVAADPEPGDA